MDLPIPFSVLSAILEEIVTAIRAGPAFAILARFQVDTRVEILAGMRVVVLVEVAVLLAARATVLTPE